MAAKSLFSKLMFFLNWLLVISLINQPSTQIIYVGSRISIRMFVPHVLPKVILRLLLFLYSVLEVGEDTART